MVKKAKVFKPGDYVFAKVKGYPAWPAKVTTTNGKKYSIFFFGTGETGNLPSNDLFDYFENKKQFLAKAIKRRDYNEGLTQIEYEISQKGLQEQPAESTEDAPESADVSQIKESDPNNTTANDTLDEEDKTEESIADVQESEKEIPTETAKPNEAEETEAEPEAAAEVTEKEVAEEAPAPAEAVPATPGRGKRNIAPKTPPSAKTPRRALKVEPITPKPEPKTPVQEATSRSGRKLKPKRYMDESEEQPEAAPVGKRAKLGDETPIVEKESPAAEVATVDRPEKLKKGKKSLQNGDGKILEKFNIVNANELEDIQEPFRSKDGEEGQGKENILLCYLPTGKFVGIKLFQDRPETFGTPAAQRVWENTMARNSLRLKRQLESGEIKPDSIPTQLETNLQLTDSEISMLKKEREIGIQMNRLSFFRTENKLLELELKIKGALSFNSPDVETCVELLGQMGELEVKPVMLLKHPGLLETVKRVRRYVGNTAEWQLPASEEAEFQQQAHRIRKRAQHCYNTFKALFTWEEGKTFLEYFSNLVLRFKRCTKDLSELELLELDEEPAGFWKPGHLTMRAAAEELDK